MWIARDKNGRLFLYYTKPKRRKDNWHEKGTPYLQMERTQFPDLKWEDNPIEVKLVPSAAEVIVLPSEEEINDKAIDIAMRICGDDYWRDCEEGFVAGVDWLKSKIAK